MRSAATRKMGWRNSLGAPFFIIVGWWCSGLSQETLNLPYAGSNPAQPAIFIQMWGCGVNGNTEGSEPSTLGSNPSDPATFGGVILTDKKLGYELRNEGSIPSVPAIF